MALESVILSGASQAEEDKYADIPSVWNLRGSDTDVLTYKTETEKEHLPVHTAVFKLGNQKGPTV